MLVYMMLNTIEERAYIGQTKMTMAARIKLHHEEVAEGSRTPIHTAMRRWDSEDFWLCVVLQNCYTEDELNRSEELWIERCHTAESGVGYNVKRVATGGKKQAPMSPERREFFRECGRRGAQRSKELAFKR